MSEFDMKLHKALEQIQIGECEYIESMVSGYAYKVKDNKFINALIDTNGEFIEPLTINEMLGSWETII